jgi:hypothetical protein
MALLTVTMRELGVPWAMGYQSSPSAPSLTMRPDRAMCVYAATAQVDLGYELQIVCVCVCVCV